MAAALLCICACGLSPTAAAEAQGEHASLDVRYYPGRDRQVLDVFAPEGAKGAPVFVFVHGGGWVGGDKNFFGRYRSIGRYLARHGVVSVLINYRLSPAVRHPEHVKDVARAFAWTRRHIADYGGDPDRIVLGGHSAGGHLVALLATDERYLKDPELKLTQADLAAIRGVVGVCGVYRIPLPDEADRIAESGVEHLMHRAGLGPSMPPTFSELLLEAGRELNPYRRAFGSDAQTCRQASPINHVHKGLPPFLIVYAERELPGLADMARDFAAALTRAGDAVDLKCISGRSHGRILFRLAEPDDPVGTDLLTFIARTTARRP